MFSYSRSSQMIPKNSTTTYFPGLNGIRAIAALAVVVTHTTMDLPRFNLDPNIFGETADRNLRSLDLAGYGVTMFFALSGFLITYLLTKEKAKGHINIKKFYMRRILRIWPLYYAYLILILFFTRNWAPFEPTTTALYVFFGANIPYILGTPMHLLGHYWSLGVEEQFYLFWPWINRLKKDRVLKVSIIVICSILLLRFYLQYKEPGSFLSSFLEYSRFHCMLFGCITALFFYEKSKLIDLLTSTWVQLLNWIIMLIVALNFFPVMLFSHEITAVVTCIIILGQIQGSGIINLENKMMNFIGKISYGIYVIHPFLIREISKFLQPQTNYEILNYLIVFTSVIITTIVVASLSYRFLETPFLRLKERKYQIA